MPNIATLEQMEVRLLSEFSQTFLPTGFFNRLILTPIPVLFSRGNYTIGLNGLKIYDTQRAPRTQAKQVDHEYSSGEYRTYEHSLSHPLDKKELQRAQETGASMIMGLKENTIGLLMNLLELDREKQSSDIVFGASYYHSNNKDDVNATPWSNHSTGDPVGDIRDAIQAVKDSGADPNSLVMNGKVFATLATHPDLIEFFKNQMGLLSPEQVKSLFPEIKKLVIADCMYNTGTDEAEVLTNLWGNHCAVYPIHTPQEMAMGKRVHAAMFDKLNDYHSYEHDQGVLVNYTQMVEYGVEAINSKAGFLIQNVLG